MISALPSEDPWIDLFDTIATLVMCHSPSGSEGEIDTVLLERLRGDDRQVWQDPAGNIIAKIPGRLPESLNPQVPEAGAIAITAHKDEIGMTVTGLEAGGCVRVRALGGSFPWVYGEGPVDLLGDQATITGILSFGSRHVSHQSPQSRFEDKAALRWPDAWIDTKCTRPQLEKAGIHPGTAVVVGKHRKQPLRLGNYIASYTLDNKASLAILLQLAHRLQNPKQTVYLVASAKEEVGAVGAMYFSQRHPIDRLIALEICPLAAEYPIVGGDMPVLLAQDAYGLYHKDFTQEIVAAAAHADIPIQQAVLERFGSDASIAMKFGHIAQGACLSFPTHNTHGYEIAHLGAIQACADLLVHYLS